MEHKKFNLERALAGDQVICKHNETHDQYEVIRIIHIPEAFCSAAKIAAVVADFPMLKAFFEDGGGESYSLFMAPKKVKYYFASFKPEGMICDRATTNMYDSKDKLMSTGRMKELNENNYILHEIEIEE